MGGNRNGNFSIRLRVDSVDGSIRPDEIMTFGESLVHLCPHPLSRVGAREQWPLTEASKTRYHPRVCGISTEEGEACTAPYNAPHGRAGSLSDLPAAPQLPARHEGVAAIFAVPLRGSRLHADLSEESAARQHIGLARELGPAHFPPSLSATICCGEICDTADTYTHDIILLDARSSRKSQRKPAAGQYCTPSHTQSIWGGHGHVWCVRLVFVKARCGLFRVA